MHNSIDVNVYDTHIGRLTSELAKFLSNHNDPKIRVALVSRWNNDIPKNIIKKLTKDKDIDVANAAKDKLKK